MSSVIIASTEESENGEVEQESDAVVYGLGINVQLRADIHVHYKRTQCKLTSSPATAAYSGEPS